MQSLDSAVYGSSQAAEDPLAGKRQLGRALQRPSTRHKVLAKVEHGKFDGIPQLVAPVSVSHHALDVQVDIAPLQYQLLLSTLLDHKTCADV